MDGALASIIEKATARGQFGLPPAQMTDEDIERKLGEGIAARYQQISEFKNALANYLINFQLNKKKSFFSKW